MRRLNAILLATFALLLSACAGQNKCGTDKSEAATSITMEQIQKTTDTLKMLHGKSSLFRIERGVSQVAALWRAEDGTAEEFEAFCRKMFVADEAELSKLYDTLERNFEVMIGHFHKIDSHLKRPLHVSGPATTELDMLFGYYDVYAHLDDDMFSGKVAFVTALNFPFYTLEEKSRLGESWSRREWAYARMGDRFISRVPASIKQGQSKVLTENDTYIAEYNIVMGNLVDENGQRLFPEDMKLISHWGLRDELKSNYANKEQGLTKQRMIYQVMKRIIDQTLPENVVGNEELLWEPYSNKIVDASGADVAAKSSDDMRYVALLNNFLSSKALDPYFPHYPTQIDRAIDRDMEIPLAEVKSLFISLLTSPQVREVASFIAGRLGRPLEPFDIWYDGFKPRGTMSEDELTKITSKLYPNPDALKADLPHILVKLGWTPEEAERITSLIVVDPSRGAGHAMGSMMRGDVARLRTRIGEKGMDYKGYNIAVHEFGHNVEQTISMNDVDYYMLNGVPNTGFTEALAFLFQLKDLQLLGLQTISEEDMYYMALDKFWSCYEIMGVSLVDIAVWEWMYANTEASPAELKEALLKIAKEVWNSYYADILGGKDETLLGIYSHMLVYPLYLPNYSVGHLINFQIEKYMGDKNLAKEVQRMFSVGRILPNHWMKHAVGAPISTEPILTSTSEALRVLRK